MPLLGEAGRILVGVLGLYGVFRIYDLVNRGALMHAFAFTYEASMFQLEFLAGVILPMVLLAIPAVRANARGLYGAALLAVFGFIVHRLNVSLTGFRSADAGQYTPSWGEAFVTLMIVALGFGAFSLAVRFFNVFPPEGEGAPREQLGSGGAPADGRPQAGTT
jgi:Ni/Fe-hydrogenase subunit HybB-like protein